MKLLEVVIDLHHLNLIDGFTVQFLNFFVLITLFVSDVYSSWTTRLFQEKQRTLIGTPGLCFDIFYRV